MSQIQAIVPANAIWLPQTYTSVLVASNQTIIVRRSGAIESYDGSNITPIGWWNANSAGDAGDAYEVRMQAVAGSWTGNITDTWLPITSDKFWTCPGTPYTVSGVLYIRRIGMTGTLTALVSCSVLLQNTM